MNESDPLGDGLRVRFVRLFYWGFSVSSGPLSATSGYFNSNSWQVMWIKDASLFYSVRVSSLRAFAHSVVPEAFAYRLK